MSRWSSKQRRSRARRREAARVITREVELAVVDQEPEVVVLAASELACVFEVHRGDDVVLCVSGPGAPWVYREGRA